MNLIFASGFLFPQKIIGKDYFRGLPHEYPDACFPNVPVIGSVQQRAQALADQAVERFPNGDIHIIAHSMGGLDARYLLSHNLLGLANPGRVTSLSMIATPHYGTPVADLLVGAKPELKDSRSFAYEAVSKVLSLMSIPFGALEDLTRESAQQFNRENPKQDHIRYLAYAGSGKGAFLLAPIRSYIESQGNTEDEKTNDGLVSLASAKWPGELAEPPWPTDHLGEVGHDLNSFGQQPNFDHFAAFDRIIRNVVAVGK